jgi:hypothetical protein
MVSETSTGRQRMELTISRAERGDVLVDRTRISRTVEEVFDFFGNAHNLERLAPPFLRPCAFLGTRAHPSAGRRSNTPISLVRKGDKNMSDEEFIVSEETFSQEEFQLLRSLVYLVFFTVAAADGAPQAPQGHRRDRGRRTRGVQATAGRATGEPLERTGGARTCEVAAARETST